MNKNEKEWLVRTRTGEILGPFTQHELVEEMQKRTFYPEDEIAPAFGQWVSAQGLSHHDVDEVTRTSTRSQTFSRQTTSTPDAHLEVEEVTPTPTPEFIRPFPSPQTKTPTPDPISGSHTIPEMRLSIRNWAPIALAVIVLMGLWKFVGELKPSPQNNGTQTNNSSHSLEESSPFLREIYGMIHEGKNQAALKKLTEMHERGGNSDDDYLIPYAGLLMTEKESESRARRNQRCQRPGSSPWE